jgi:hypothetical protein
MSERTLAYSGHLRCCAWCATEHASHVTPCMHCLFLLAPSAGPQASSRAGWHPWQWPASGLLSHERFWTARLSRRSAPAATLHGLKQVPALVRACLYPRQTGSSQASSTRGSCQPATRASRRVLFNTRTARHPIPFSIKALKCNHRPTTHITHTTHSCLALRETDRDATRALDRALRPAPNDSSRHGARALCRGERAAGPGRRLGACAGAAAFCPLGLGPDRPAGSSADQAWHNLPLQQRSASWKVRGKVPGSISAPATGTPLCPPGPPPHALWLPENRRSGLRPANQLLAGPRGAVAAPSRCAAAVMRRAAPPSHGPLPPHLQASRPRRSHATCSHVAPGSLEAPRQGSAARTLPCPHPSPPAPA